MRPAVSSPKEEVHSRDWRVDRPLNPHPPIRRIGLLSPTSGNLGNATMQWAMIANIRQRIADVEMVGITLNPDDTRRRHGIEAFPLAGVSRPYYALANSRSSHRQAPLTRERAGIKQWLKRVPILGSLLRAVRTGLKEIAHTAAAARLVRKLDRLLVPGGGAVDDFWGGPWGQPWALCKWSLLCRVFGVPFWFVSIGKCSLERPLSRFFIRIALRLAQYRSYRDSESKIAMQTLIDVRRDPVYPDLAFSYPCPVVPSEPGAGATDRNLVVGVSPIAYCDPRVWPRPDAQRYAAYLGRLAEMVKWLINEGYRVLFFTTDSPDTAAVDDIKSLLSGSTLDANAIQTLPGSAEQSPDSLLQGLSGVHLTVASRLHGVILSHLSATPVLALSFDPKVDAHMHAMEQQAYCLSIDQLQPVRLIERFKALRALREREAAAIGNAGQAFRRQLDSQYDRLLGAPLSLPIKGAYPRPVEASPRSEWGRVGTR